LEDLNVDGRILFKWILKKWKCVDWIDLAWVSEQVVGYCEGGNEVLGSI
jgi:activator of HSP90 ATPase